MVSKLGVMVNLSGNSCTPNSSARTVVTAMLMTLTVLPALLIVVGERVNWPHRFARRSTDSAGAWGRWARATMERPWRFLVPSLLVFAVLIIPTLRLKAWNVGPHDLPPATEARQGYDLLARSFAPGWMAPIALFVESPSGTLATPERQGALLATYGTLAADPRVRIARVVPAPDGRRHVDQLRH